VTGHHDQGAGWVLDGAVAALARRGVHVRLSAVTIKRVRAAADALLRELTTSATVQDDDWEQQLAARVRIAREHAGLTRAALAEVAGMSTPTVVRCEAGDREMTAYDMACLARALGVYPGILVPQADDPSPPEQGGRADGAGHDGL